VLRTIKAEHMEHVPFALDLGFALLTLVCVIVFLRATGWPRVLAVVIGGWAALLAALGLTGFYLQTQGWPPRFAMVIGLPLLGIAALFATQAGRRFIDRADPAMLTLFHVVRVPVELVLFGLFAYGAVPELMTFEGRNFDVWSGLTAPLIFWFGYKRKVLRRWALIAWNSACLGLLLNIVINAILAAPFDFQTQAFDRPNVAVLYVPYVWLPGVVVPLVLCAHLICLRTLIRSK